MRIIDENLFFIEFGEPQAPASYSFNHKHVKPIYIVAHDYTGAEKKANEYLKMKLDEMKQSVLTEDGSLNNSEPPIIKVISVKLVSDELVY